MVNNNQFLHLSLSLITYLRSWFNYWLLGAVRGRTLIRIFSQRADRLRRKALSLTCSSKEDRRLRGETCEHRTRLLSYTNLSSSI